MLPSLRLVYIFYKYIYNNRQMAQMYFDLSLTDYFEWNCILCVSYKNARQNLKFVITQQVTKFIIEIHLHTFHRVVFRAQHIVIGVLINDDNTISLCSNSYIRSWLQFREIRLCYYDIWCWMVMIWMFIS